MSLLKYTVIFLVVLSISESARILIIMPTPSYSHHLAFNPLWLALHERGHQITLLTTNPLKNNVNSRDFKQIDLSFAYEIWHDKHNFSDILHNFNTNLIKCFNQYVEMMNEIFERELQHEQVKELIQDKDKKFDLIISELLHPGMLAFSVRFNCPFIGVSPMDLTIMGHELLGNPTNPAVYSDFVMPFDCYMSFLERVQNTYYYFFHLIYFKYYFYPKVDKIVAEYFGVGYPGLEEIQKNASLVFLNVNPVTHDIRPLLPNVIPLGAPMHLLGAKNNPLPDDVKTFLDSAENGAILFSLGTNVKSQDLSDGVKKAIVDTFDELPYKILWKFEQINITDNPKFMIRTWLPQREILGHSNIKLFITHGGLLSIQEAIYYEIPVLGMPVFLDQYSNMKRLERKGLGLTLDYRNLKKDDFKSAITQIINDTSYKEKAKYWSDVLKDQPISPLVEAVNWVEHVLKKKGLGMIKQRHQIPLYQFFLLDISLFILLTLSLCIYLWYKCVFFSLRWIVKRRRNKRTKLD